MQKEPPKIDDLDDSGNTQDYGKTAAGVVTPAVTFDKGSTVEIPFFQLKKRIPHCTQEYFYKTSSRAKYFLVRMLSKKVIILLTTTLNSHVIMFVCACECVYTYVCVSM